MILLRYLLCEHGNCLKQDTIKHTCDSRVGINMLWEWDALERAVMGVLVIKPPCPLTSTDVNNPGGPQSSSGKVVWGARANPEP